MTSSVGKEGEKLAKEGEQLASSERRREARFLYLEKEKQASFGKGSRLPLAKEAGFSASGPLSLRVGGLVFAVMRGWRHAFDHGFYVCIMKESSRRVLDSIEAEGSVPAPTSNSTEPEALRFG